MNITEVDALNYESRLSTLEERSTSQATKEDLSNLKADIIKWFLGIQISLAALLIYLLQ